MLYSILFLIISCFFIFITFSTAYAIESPEVQETRLNDQYTMEKVVDGLVIPTAMTFIGNDILVIEKNSGKVIHVNIDNNTKNTILDLPVIFGDESGLLGITSIENSVFIYLTESLSGSDQYKMENARIVIYRYTWDEGTLTNPVLIKELPVSDQDSHIGGAMTSDDNAVYFVVGDQRQHVKYQNIPNVQTNSKYITSSIFKYNIHDDTVEHFAMGIRNSFGLAIDSVTGNLWDTENGENYFDEINLVQPKFNSGWKMVMGPTERINLDTCQFNHELGNNSCLEWIFLERDNPQKIPVFEDFEYSEPEFSFWDAVGITAIEFPDENGFGELSNYAFVGDFNNGRIYKLQLNSDRTGFTFENPRLNDLVLEFTTAEHRFLIEKYPNYIFEHEEIIFATDVPGGLTDIEFHNGEMYIVSIFDGSIYKIFPNQNTKSDDDTSLQSSKSTYFLDRSELTATGSINVELSNSQSEKIFKFDIPRFDQTNTPEKKLIVPFDARPIENSQVLEFISGKLCSPCMNDVNLGINYYEILRWQDVDVFDRLTAIFTSPSETFPSFSSHEEVFNFIKNEEESFCENATMVKNYQTCQDRLSLGNMVINLPNNHSAYTVMSKTDNKYLALAESFDHDVDGVGYEPLTFYKIPRINLSSYIFTEDKVWIINSIVYEPEFEWFIADFFHMTHKFTLNDSLPIVIESSESPTQSQSVSIPEWVKNNAAWWADGQIDDNTFATGIEFMIKQGVISVPSTQSGVNENATIPDWVRNNAAWWADGQIDDNTFARGLQFLIKEGIISV